MAAVIIPSGSSGLNGHFSDLQYDWPDSLTDGSQIPLMGLPLSNVPSAPDSDGGYYWGGVQATSTSTVDLTLGGSSGRVGIWTNTRVDGNFTRLWWSQDTDGDGFPLPLPTLDAGYYLIQFGSRSDVALISFNLEGSGPAPVELFFTHLIGTKES